MAADPFAEFKAKQREAWKLVAPLNITCQVSPHLVRFAGVRPGQKVLEVGAGTGVAALAARRAGAQVTGIDLTPELLARAEENAAPVGAGAMTWREGDAENLPFPDAGFDVVLSQFGHMFAPRHQVAADEMLRVQRPGGTVAFATWPPHLLAGRLFALVGRSRPGPPARPDHAPRWGDQACVEQRLGGLGGRVRDVAFGTGTMNVPTIRAAHIRAHDEPRGPSSAS